ncbi:MAG TPA: DUF3137 domain-containing protein [Blastocatellia bacterium]|jgi:hypothetical protein|nr:DUF3137 domain-containing protein [Blastocatellia bacterium]
MGFFKKIFGPSQEEVWGRVSREIGAEFIKGGFFKGVNRIEARVQNWTITLDTYTVSTGKSTITFTRMRAPFVTRDGFRFTIHHKSIFTGMGKMLGMQDVEVGGPKFEHLEPLFGLRGYLDTELIETGYPEFDDEFVIKGTDESKLKILFKNLKIRELIEGQPELLLQVKAITGWLGRRKYDGVDELYFQVVGIIKDPERLKQLFELFSEVLKSLHAMGTALDDTPILR